MTIDLIEQDKSQRLLALDASKSFIVQAPAGSGKTELLIQRFLTLLNYVKAPEEILAITFTKKAANEMRIRIIKALKQAQLDTEPESAHAKHTWTLARQVLERDKQRNWHLINNPNQLRIQTIDSLCAYLTKQLPVLSHFGSQPDIADDSVFLYREAVQEVLSHVEQHVEWAPSISQLLLHLDNDLNKLHDLLVSLVQKRDQWLPYIQINTNDTDIRNRLEQHLSAVITESLTALYDIFPNDLLSELIAIARFAADNLVQNQIESEITLCRNLTQHPQTKAADQPVWLGLAKLLLTKNFSWRKRVDEDIGFPALASIKNANEKMLHTEYRQRLNALISKLSDHETLRLALTEIFFLPEAHYQDAQWEILKSLLHVLKIVSAQLRLTFQQHGKIDFIENAQAALSALGYDDHPTDLALALDYQIKHILIDEFQDTAFTQYQLLEKLIAGWETDDGRTLFVVGDPMQSIYRFREAEVGLFIRMRKTGIGHVKLIPLTLSVNFRASSHLVAWNNQHFQKIFPSFNEIATGAVSYSPSVSNKVSDPDNQHSTVTMKGFLDPDQQTQANHIITLIEAVKKHHPEENIAILVRSRTHLSTLLPALKKANIAYHAVDIDPLASRQTIQDLLSLTCALLHPADRIAWLAILRAPWCGLTLADLLIIAGSNPHATIYEQLIYDTTINQLSADGRIRLARVVPLLKSKMAERERTDLRTWVESTWILLGGPACLHDYTEIDDAEAYFKLLDAFYKNNPTLNLDKLKEKINRLYAAGRHDHTSLQIMTIHAAKGLEFDTVILPYLERKMPSDDKSLLSWMERPLADDQTALLLAPIHATGDNKDTIYEYINRQQKIKSDYETDRLFYVAATRAKKRLFLYFDAHQNEKGNIKIESDSFLEKLWPFIENQQEHVIISGNANTAANNQHEEHDRPIQRLSSAWINPITASSSNTISLHQKQNGFLLEENLPKLIGIIAHRILQLIAERSIHWWQENAKQHNNYIKRQLIQAGTLPHQLESAVNTVANIIDNAIHDARGRWILHMHQEAKSEFAISTIIDNQPENLVIDRMFIDENNIRWIIDYKTTTFSHDDLDRFLEKEQEKYLEKMRKYHDAIKLLDHRHIRLGLYFPALPAWKEWEF